MLEQAVYLIGNAFRIYIYWKFLNFLFHTAKVKNIWIMIGFFAYFFINSAVALTFSNFTLNIVTNVVPLFALSFLYESKISSKFFLTLAFYVMNMLADGIMCTLMFITKRDMIVIRSGIATVLLTFLIELVFEYIWNKRQYHELDILYLVAILAVPIGSIAVGILTMYNYSIKTIIVAFILIGFNILIFYMYDNLQKNYEMLYEKKILEQAVEAQHSELELMKESQERIRFLQHDFKNHLIAIESQAKREDYTGIIQYIKESFHFLSVDRQLVDTGNPEIDSILNYKLQEMQNKKIEIEHSVTIPKNLRISGFDINIVLGNLLNNAMEAIEKTKEKKLFLHISFDKNILFIHIENTYNGTIIESEDGFMTIKKDKQMHGIGLKSVSNILEKYDGDIMFSYDDNLFKTDVMMCNTIVKITRA